MGVIKDGSVSGFLPSTEAFAVLYPGYPSSTSRAIDTLGGTEGIVKARSLKSNKLELHFRPEDPYSHPAFGEHHSCNKLLLKISKKKSSEDLRDKAYNRTSECTLEKSNISELKTCASELVGDGQKVSQPESESNLFSKTVEERIPEKVHMNLSAEIVGRVSEAYHFNGMVDYQHVLAVHADVAQRKKRSWADVEPHFEKTGLMDLDQENLMILVPPLFSPKDIPEELVLKRPSTLSSKKQQEGVIQPPEMNIEPNPNYFMDFNIEEIPKKINWEKRIPQDQWELQMAVSKLFEERPIWPKISVAERLYDSGFRDVGDNTLKRLLFRLAYYFSNGPFLRFWIRNEYDPRKDPESRIYQIIDFRVPTSLQSYCDANKGNELKHRWKDLCSFRVFPHKCHTSLQFFELDDDYIQQEIRKPPKPTTCTSTTGWFSDLVLENLRSRVSVRFLSVYPKTGAEKQLKSASERFEKSKRMLIHNNLRLDEVWQQPVNKLLESDKDKEEAQDVAHDEDETEEAQYVEFNDAVLESDKEEAQDVAHDEDETEEAQYVEFNDAVLESDKEEAQVVADDEDETEADNDEEELDAYEPLHLADEDGEISRQQVSHFDGENISRSYLQELFGSFPSILAGGSKVQDAETSDGEYQIYEHNNDGNSDDDY